MADVFKDRLDNSYNELKAKHGDRVDVMEENKFVGFDAYQHAIAMADVVILATPPGFRPPHFEEAVRQGKHIFMEKPVAVDGPGVRKVLAAAEEAKRKISRWPSAFNAITKSRLPRNGAAPARWRHWRHCGHALLIGMATVRGSMSVKNLKKTQAAR
jgi:hypothetical protein